MQFQLNHSFVDLLENLRSSFNTHCESQSRRILSRPAFFIVFMVFIALNLGVLYWVLSVRLPLLQQVNQMMANKVVLTMALAEQEAVWSKEAINTIDSKISLAEKSVFKDFKDLLYWLSEQQSTAADYDFDLKYRFLEIKEKKINDTFVIPIELDLYAKQAYPAEQFNKLQAYLHQLISGQYHVEVSSLEAKSLQYGLAELNLTLQLWINDREHLLQYSESAQGEADDKAFIQ